MKLYNLFGNDMIKNKNFNEFVVALQQTPEAKGHILFFGQAEKYCDFAKWNESVYHREEAKVNLL